MASMASEARTWFGLDAALSKLGIGADARVEARVSSATVARPTPSLGYWRGGGADGFTVGGQGSGYGPPHQGAGAFRQGEGPSPAARAWEPTVWYLVILVAAEVVLFAVLGRVLERLAFIEELTGGAVSV